MSPTNGSQLRKASREPYFSMRCLWDSSFSRVTRNHFSIHSHLPSQPMAYEVRPPSQFPAVAQMNEIMGSPPATRRPISNTSAENGTMVEAMNEPMNSPMYPQSCKNSIFSRFCLAAMLLFSIYSFVLSYPDCCLPESFIGIACRCGSSELLLPVTVSGQPVVLSLLR